MRNFRNWDVWQNGRGFVKKFYSLTKNFPGDEKFGLISQLRRATVSIPVNIAEGAGRNSEKELRQFLYMAIGSAFEVETLLILANDVDIITEEEKQRLIEELEVIQKQLNSFIGKLQLVISF